MTSDRRNSIVSLGIKSKRGGGGGFVLISLCAERVHHDSSSSVRTVR